MIRSDFGSWGRLTQPIQDVKFLYDRTNLLPLFEGAYKAVPYGNGRSYGDVCLNPEGGIWSTQQLNKFIEFNESLGILRCESGVLLRDIQRMVIPRGWMLPVTPGTQLVTLGGAIANDVHGKNHHVRGSFGNHIKNISLLRTDGTFTLCGAGVNEGLFHATIGGLGLTGVITEASVQLIQTSGPLLSTEIILYEGMKEFSQLADSSESGWEHTVSWIDCLSGKSANGVFMRANHISGIQKSEPKNTKITMPITPPFSLVNNWTLKPLNYSYRALQKIKAGKHIAHYESFLYPLDNVSGWNKMYGKKGFYQYQSVVPRDCGPDAVEEMLKELKRAGVGSFLAVLKTLGQPKSLGMLSFPMPGFTLALDFPNQGNKTLKLFERLDVIVSESKGRIYAAKDARMSRSIFESGYPRFKEFLKYRDLGISSAMSRRLMGS